MGILDYISPSFKVRRGSRYIVIQEKLEHGHVQKFSPNRVGISFDNSKVSVCTSELVCNLHRLFPVKLPLLLSILIPNRHMR